MQRSSPEVSDDVLLNALPPASGIPASPRIKNNCDLEEGEIPSVETCPLQHVRDEEASLSATVGVQGAPVMDTVEDSVPQIAAPLKRISFGAFDVLATLSSGDDDDDEISLSVGALQGNDIQFTKSTVAPAEADTSNPTLKPPVSGIQQDNHNRSAVEQERDKPFFLVQNGKSGRKVTKNH